VLARDAFDGGDVRWMSRAVTSGNRGHRDRLAPIMPTGGRCLRDSPGSSSLAHTASLEPRHMLPSP
jgi:hypothetical protein